MNRDVCVWYAFKKEYIADNGVTIPIGTPLYQLQLPVIKWGAWDRNKKEFIVIFNKPDTPQVINRKQPGTLIRLETK